MKTSWRAWVGVAGLLLNLTASYAGTFTWTGLSGTSNVLTPGNWQGGVVPTGATTDDIIFGDSSINNPLFPNTFSIRDITLSALNTGYFLDGSGSTPVLTLTGNVRSLSGSGPFLVFSQVGVNLAAGSHAFDVQGGDIYFFNHLFGSGNIVKTGSRSLVVASGDSTNSDFTGNITLSDGTLSVAGDQALGSGTITMNGGTLTVANYYDDDHRVSLANSLIFNSNVKLGESFTDAFNQPIDNLMEIQGNVNSASSSNVAIADHNLFVFAGTLTATNLTFSGPGSAYFYSSNTITGTLTVNDGVVVFAESLPSSNTIIATNHGYVGAGLSNSEQTFLNRFNKAATTGIVGFDSIAHPGPYYFDGNIDLTGFNSSARLGTATSATLNGTITPQGSVYQFGGRGELTVTSALTGSRQLTVNDGLLLYLTGTNTYSGGTTANSGAIIFSGSSAVPSAGSLNAGSNGYIGNTESASLSESAFLAKFNQSSTTGVVGFDADSLINGRNISSNLDLSGFDSSAFLGTATNVTFTNSVTITPGGSSYNFTGFRDGQLTVNSTLSGSRSVVIGLAADDIDSVAPIGSTFNPSVTLGANNSYTGGTTLQSGMLILGHGHALGTGTLTVANFQQQRTGLQTTTNLTINNAIDIGSNDYFLLGGTHNFNLAGSLSSSSGSIDKIDVNTVTLSGANSGLNATLQVRSGTLTFASDTAAGTGDLELYNSTTDGDTSTAEFTSAAPIVGSLFGESSTVLSINVGPVRSLTVNQSTDRTFSGEITGNGGLTKAGIATLELTGSNSYSGTTTVNAGTLKASNDSSFGSGSVLLNGGSINVASGVTLANTLAVSGSGGTLTGSGAFSASNVSIGANTFLAPGDGVGALAFGGGLTFAQGGAYNFEIKSAVGVAGTGFDTVTTSGVLNFTATLGTPFRLNLISLTSGGSAGALADFNSSNSYSWAIASSTSGITGFTPGAITVNTSQFTNSLGAGSFNVSTSGNTMYLNFTPVPEPSTWAMLASGAGIVAWITRRRSRA